MFDNIFETSKLFLFLLVFFNIVNFPFFICLIISTYIWCSFHYVLYRLCQFLSLSNQKLFFTFRTVFFDRYNFQKPPKLTIPIIVKSWMICIVCRMAYYLLWSKPIHFCEFIVVSWRLRFFIKFRGHIRQVFYW